MIKLTDKLAQQEIAYVRKYKEFQAYDGRVIAGFFFESIPEHVNEKDMPCSKRYLDVLIKVQKGY